LRVARLAAASVRSARLRAVVRAMTRGPLEAADNK
jgi:hypothetical protein